MQDPFSQQDTEMEEAPPNIRFPMSDNRFRSTKYLNVINRGERKKQDRSGAGRSEVKPKTNPTCSSGFHSLPLPKAPACFLWLLPVAAYMDSSFCPHLPPSPVCSKSFLSCLFINPSLLPLFLSVASASHLSV